mmetsp:Transcript_11983/g.17347  ORF Transcript_11983/g.17347 Transcript_11983/m.17347 type:complete len:225 (+) Transcript_11983:79-753(+)|eukprot:CAMPEP_0195523804 /NCGR_PEP_ID=MMETSP0794_2-20130614/23242_1 /TAXON_ID=515487 /ORGANISM="Stephanopyxis turris, Strain CCMP 815" /LENGTH=224 /DNA_ID=CAMNT_0040653879 /DNA_START=59 /DNA_END=733 /DNA_ORIENTATION=-
MMGMTAMWLCLMMISAAAPQAAMALSRSSCYSPAARRTTTIVGVPFCSPSTSSRLARGLVSMSAEKEDSNNDFWSQQKALAEEMTADSEAVERRNRETMKESFAKRRLALVSDTAFFSVLIFSVLWCASTTPFTSVSYLFGALLGTAYSYGLGKYVETIGGSVDDTESVQGAGVGQARFAFLIALFILLGKFRGQIGLQEIPTIAGFFTYQLATLNAGFKEVEE